jgi:dienelactone hydrolase
MASGLAALVIAAVGLTVALTTSGRTPRRSGRVPATTSSNATVTPPPVSPPPRSFAVGIRVLHLVDDSRTIELSNGTREPRALLTYVRYPALGAPNQTDLPDAPAARADGPFPLVIFGHGYAVTPALYAGLLQSWARAGYVVAAPVFPLENAGAPEGPQESDLINQPDDMRFVMSSLLAASNASSGALAGLINPDRIAVTGQSDGGDTALAVAYNRYFRDPRVSAVVILSGAEIPGASGFVFGPGGPPLLATQGTADTVNPPSATDAFFYAARRPKYLLNLIGAEHLPPYSYQQPQLEIIERVTIAFFDGYLKHMSGALERLAALGSVPGTASLLTEP